MRILFVSCALTVVFPVAVFSQSGWYIEESPTGADLHDITAGDELIPTSVFKDWDALTRDGGTWITHDNIGSFDAYGMKFTWGLWKKTVNGLLYVIKDGHATDTLFEYKLYYHPTEKKIILEQYGRDGTVGLGEVATHENLKSTSISTFYNPDGSIVRLKHVQEMMGDLKTSQVFIADSLGRWVKSRYYEWRRMR